MTTRIVFTKDPFAKKSCFCAVVNSRAMWVYRTTQGWKTAVRDGIGTKWFEGVHKSRKVAERAILQLTGETV